MLIDEIRIYPLDLSFSGDFSHSRKTGGGARNILVEVTAEKGAIRGFGEGAPREYVTGETRLQALESARALASREDFPWEVSGRSEIMGFINRVPQDKTLNSAICALEIATLDALGRHMHKGIKAFLPEDFATETVKYGATLPLADPDRIREICSLIALAGIDKIRVKVGPDLDRNRRSLEAVRAALPGQCDLRIDANGCWDADTAASHLELVKAAKVRIVEQPLAPGDPLYPQVAAAYREYGIVLMADESACTLSETAEIVRQGAFGAVNVRLSKCGGFSRSLEVLTYLRSMGMPFQIGCQLGESGILSAAGRALALSARDAMYYDGSYDAFLLAENLTSSHVSFGKGGVAGRLPGEGLGVEVDPERLGKMCPTHISVKRPMAGKESP